MSEQPQVRHATVMDDDARQAARVYAEALYGAAESQGLATEAFDELNQLTYDVFDKNPEFEVYLASDTGDRRRRAEGIEQTFRGRASDLFVQFLLTLNEQGRLELIRPIAEAYRRIHLRKTRRVVVNATSAVPLTDDERRRLGDDVRAVADAEPILRETVDPEMLGGLIIQVGDWVYDASVRAKIDIIRKQVVGGGSHVASV